MLLLHWESGNGQRCPSVVAAAAFAEQPPCPNDSNWKPLTERHKIPIYSSKRKGK